MVMSESINPARNHSFYDITEVVRDAVSQLKQEFPGAPEIANIFRFMGHDEVDTQFILRTGKREVNASDIRRLMAHRVSEQTEEKDVIKLVMYELAGMIADARAEQRSGAQRAELEELRRASRGEGH